MSKELIFSSNVGVINIDRYKEYSQSDIENDNNKYP